MDHYGIVPLAVSVDRCGLDDFYLFSAFRLSVPSLVQEISTYLEGDDKEGFL